jgi:hypothetical protein
MAPLELSGEVVAQQNLTGKSARVGSRSPCGDCILRHSHAWQGKIVDRLVVFF